MTIFQVRIRSYQIESQQWLSIKLGPYLILLTLLDPLLLTIA